jgi:uncharacterized protein YndB with AHSA1/START domain
MAPLTPVDTSFIADAPFRLENELIVEATPADVWAVVIDTARWPEWFPDCNAARPTSDPAAGVGATRWVHMDLFKVNERIVAWEEPQRWGFTLLDANLPGIESVAEEIVITPVGDGRTRVTYRFGGKLKPWMRPTTFIFRARLDPMFKKGLAGLKAHIEEMRQAG